MLLVKLISVVGAFVLVAWLLFRLLGDIVIGPPNVLDGNTIEVRNRRIILYGIDAPDLAQTCEWIHASVPCGIQARDALAQRLAHSVVWCLPKVRRDTVLRSVCYAGLRDINRWMILQGWAIADRRHSTQYLAAEESARRHLLGIWRLRFTPPWVRREQMRARTGGGR